MPSLRVAVGPEGPGVLRIHLLVDESRGGSRGSWGRDRRAGAAGALGGGDGTVAKYQLMGGTVIFQQSVSGYPCTLNKHQSCK